MKAATRQALKKLDRRKAGKRYPRGLGKLHQKRKYHLNYTFRAYFLHSKSSYALSSTLSPLYNCRNAARRDSSLDDGRGVKKKKGEEFVGFQK